MTRFISIAAMAIEDEPDEERLLSAAAIIDDALMGIYDINPDYYTSVITRLQSVLLQKSTA